MLNFMYMYGKRERTSDTSGSGSDVMWPSSATPGHSTCSGRLPVQNGPSSGMNNHPRMALLRALDIDNKVAVGFRNMLESIVMMLVIVQQCHVRGLL